SPPGPISIVLLDTPQEPWGFGRIRRSLVRVAAGVGLAHPGPMFHISAQTAGEIALRSFLVYGTVLALLRIGGRRELGQVTTTDIVVMILIANAVQNAMVGADASLAGGLLSAITLVVTNWVVNQLRLRFPRVQRFIDGTNV